VLRPGNADTSSREREHGEVFLMEKVKFDCDCDRVIEMQDMGIGVEEILQFARGLLGREDLLSLIRGLEEIYESEGDDDGE
jgi:hypothetical protein